MADYAMYQKLHGNDRVIPRFRYESIITPEMMANDAPPAGNWIYLSREGSWIQPEEEELGYVRPRIH